MPRKETADSVKEHTEAKLQFYIRYLERYMLILLASPGISRINIYDLYCGAGIYSDGNAGSAIRAASVISQSLDRNFKQITVNLHLNDLNNQKVERLKNLLAQKIPSISNFNCSFSSKEAFAFIDELIVGQKNQNKHCRNLLFIDPYGYKDINRFSLEALLSSGLTEIVLFLPIEQMYRFKSKALDEEIDNFYLPLKRFIEQFQLDVNSITSELEFIDSMAHQLRFNDKYYSTSYAIRNHTGHHYGMFFITPNLYGLHKILEVKWELDSQLGKGFTGSIQQDFFLETEKKSELEEKVFSIIKNNDIDNLQLYEFVLLQGFLPKHASEFLKRLCADKLIHTLDIKLNKTARKNSFKLTYDEYKTQKPSIMYRSGSGESL